MESELNSLFNSKCLPLHFLILQVLRNVLNRSDCQLVRLSIAGNALGDSGAEVLRSGLEVRALAVTLSICLCQFDGYLVYRREHGIVCMSVWPL